MAKWWWILKYRNYDKGLGLFQCIEQINLYLFVWRNSIRYNVGCFIIQFPKMTMGVIFNSNTKLNTVPNNGFIHRIGTSTSSSPESIDFPLSSNWGTAPLRRNEKCMLNKRKFTYNYSNQKTYYHYTEYFRIKKQYYWILFCHPFYIRILQPIMFHDISSLKIIPTSWHMRLTN